MNKQTKEKTIKYANVNFWREIAGKNNRSYNYHHRKLYRMMEGNTCAIQAQVEDLMLETLDGLVWGFTVYIKGEKIPLFFYIVIIIITHEILFVNNFK